jgi:hypothetical protein
MNLNEWRKNGWLTEHETGSLEISDVLVVIDRDLKECQAEGLSPDWRLIIAYNAAFQTALAALAAEGFRATHEAHNFRIIQSLTYTLECDATVIAQLDAFRKKRDATNYERAGCVSMCEAVEMQELASALFAELLKWLTRKHPTLLR